VSNRACQQLLKMPVSSCLRELAGILFLLVLFLLPSTVTTSNSTRSLCYSGSILYQTNTVDCAKLDTSYNGDWYCSNIQVCEAGMSQSRICMAAKGCAKYEECANPSGGILSDSPLLLNGVNAGGMKVTVSCCKSVQIPSDDSIAIDYNLICNDSARSTIISHTVWIVASLLISVTFLMDFL